MTIPKHLNDILNTEGILVVLGSGRSGKTLTAHYLTTWSKKPVFALGYPEQMTNYLPQHWQSIQPNDVFKLKDCILFVDDAALFASNREFNSNWSRKWLQFQTIISHKNITVIFIVQSTNLLDISTLRSQRMAILFKHSDPTNILFQRPEFINIAALANQIIQKNRNTKPQIHPKAWVFDLTSGSTFNHPIPKHWVPELSTPYRDYIIEVDDK
jgi:hypothetical protein